MTDRQCGECTLCCKLLPVHSGRTINGLDAPGSWHKAAGERCRFQRHGKGCAIYASRPPSCRAWFCGWLVNDDTALLRRPDRSHYVIDCVPDFVTIVEKEEERTKIEVVQIWCDPHYRDAHEDPELRRYLVRRGEQGVAAIIRYSNREGFVLLPPAMTPSGEFVAFHHGIVREQRPAGEWAEGLAEARRERGGPDGEAQA